MLAFITFSSYSAGSFILFSIFWSCFLSLKSKIVTFFLLQTRQLELLDDFTKERKIITNKKFEYLHYMHSRHRKHPQLFIKIALFWKHLLQWKVFNLWFLVASSSVLLEPRWSLFFSPLMCCLVLSEDSLFLWPESWSFLAPDLSRCPDRFLLSELSDDLSPRG